MIHSTIRLIACACLMLAPARSLYAQAPNAPTQRGADVAADLVFVPNDVDTILVVRDARLIRQTDVGRTIRAIADELLELPRTRAAWAELAAMIDLDEDAAFDEILGSRVVFIERDAPEAGQSDQWTIVCDLRPAIADRLRTKLKAAPRRILGGVPLLAIEEGRFEMAVVGKSATSRVVLAPSRSITLLEEIASRLEGGEGDAFVGTEPAERISALTGGADGPVDAIVYRRVGDGDREGIDWIGGVIRAERFALRSEIVLRTNEIAHEVPPSSIEIFESLRDTSLLAIVEAIDPEALQADGAPTGFLDRIQTQVNSMLARTGATRYAVALQSAGDGGISASVGVQTPNAEAAAPAIDKVVNELLLALAAEAELGAWDFDYQGMQPAAVRVADLGGQFRMLGGAPLRVQWGAHDEHWWIASLPGASRATMVDAIDSQTNMITRRWLVLGVARPSQLLQALAMLMPAWNGQTPAPLRGFLDVSEVTWTAWQQTDNEVWGRIGIEVAKKR